MRCPVCRSTGVYSSAYVGGRGYMSQMVCPTAVREEVELFDAHCCDDDYLVRDEAQRLAHPRIICRSIHAEAGTAMAVEPVGVGGGNDLTA